MEPARSYKAVKSCLLSYHALFFFNKTSSDTKIQHKFATFTGAIHHAAFHWGEKNHFVYFTMSACFGSRTKWKKRAADTKNPTADMYELARPRMIFVTYVSSSSWYPIGSIIGPSRSNRTLCTHGVNQTRAQTHERGSQLAQPCGERICSQRKCARSQ